MSRKFVVDELYLENIRQEYLSAKRNGFERPELGKIIDRYAIDMGCDRSTLSRKLGLGIRPRKAKRRIDATQQELIDSAARTLFTFQQNKSREGARVTFSMAYKVLVESGTIPADIKLSQLYKSMQEQCLDTLSQATYKEWQRSQPHQLLHIDYSRSRYFKIKEGTTLVLQQPGGSYYAKDKDDATRLRLWFAIAIDDASRVAYAEYVRWVGESPSNTQDFLFNAFSEKTRVVNNGGEWVYEELYQGMPKSIYGDRGPGHGTSTERGLKALNIVFIEGNNELDQRGKKTGRSNKKAHGKVERMVGLIKQDFETKWFLKQKPGYMISLDELNQELWQWLRHRNQQQHPRIKDQIRWEMFKPSLADIEFPPDKFHQIFAGSAERIVQRREISYDGKKYHAPNQIRDNTSVELVDEGGVVYVKHRGTRIKIEPKTGSQKNPKSAPMPSDIINDSHELRMKLDEELRNRSSGKVSIRTAKETHGDDLNSFFEKPRSIEEIGLFAEVIIGESKPQAPTNIIQFPLQN